VYASVARSVLVMWLSLNSGSVLAEASWSRLASSLFSYSIWNKHIKGHPTLEWSLIHILHRKVASGS
jgi:hypothetical protein